MFSWLGDVFDRVCDGIGWVWDHTLGAVIGGVGSAIWDTMFKWLFETIYKAVAKIFQAINNSATDVFELSWVQAFVKLFYNFGWMLFACGLVVAVFDCAVAYENGSANIVCSPSAAAVLTVCKPAGLVLGRPDRYIPEQHDKDRSKYSNGRACGSHQGGVAVLTVLHSPAWLCDRQGHLCKHQAWRCTSVPDSHRFTVYVLNTERVYRGLPGVVQAGHSNLHYGIFADNYLVPWASDLLTASADGNGLMFVINRSAEGCTDVRT